MSVLGMIRRSFPFVDVDGFKLLYNVYITLDLEFCVQVWFSRRISKKTLTVCSRATLMVYGFGNLQYEERLERLNLFSLQYRRIRGDMIETDKIICSLGDVNSSQLFAVQAVRDPRQQAMGGALSKEIALRS